MSWRDDLISASINGVPFGLVDSSKSSGRRTQTHEFADVDLAFVEDSGQAPTRHSIRGFLVGDDYHVVLQRLEEQLDAGGDLEFDHPHRGKIFGLRLEGEYTTNEGRDSLGFAEISFTLVQNGLPAPMIFESRPGAVKLAAERVYVAAQAELEDRFSGLDVLKTVTRSLARLNRGMRQMQGRLLTKLGTISALTTQIDAFAAGINTMVAAPQTIATVFRGLARSTMAAVSTAASVLGREATGYANPADTMVESMDDMRNANATPEAIADKEFSTAVPPGQELAGEALVAKTDLDVFDAFVAATTVAALAEFATKIELPTADAADAFAEAIVDAIDSVLGAEIGDGPISEILYGEMLNFKSKVISYMTAVAETLPKVAVVTVAGQASAVLVAFWEFGVGGEALGQAVGKILAANTIEDPLAIPDGTQIKVVLA